MRKLTVSIDRFPIAGKFTIARGSRTEAVVVTATISEGGTVGHGECVPYPRYGETVEGVAAAIEAIAPQIEAGLTREALQNLMPAGAARNAVDCALWDLDAKRSGIRAHLTAGLTRWPPATTAYTISLGTPEEMAEAAARAAQRPILKVKFGAPDGDIERIRAVRRAAPQATLIADANEGWTEDNLEAHLAACADEGYALVEQPLPAKADEYLRRISRPVPILADESVHDRASLDRLTGLYEVINIKLDKTGGLTEALALADAAEAKGFSLMIGCMVGTSLAMAPALVLAPRARFVDLDGPLLLARDREPGLRYEGSIVYPPEPALWG
ncbi:N-acetyl-D-Glu racemase DgcA [Microvirga mediterraneensis]|uniref:Dipeptide epimerase n=1 Tax=Microvirga mediterraneensis TaxID=2754695 RepID=A0A838BLI5_9HYPH|nr:N-acetyl-D-Glu racemase DgcA [Microvirga mediterraneensis]MBA1156534.1 L-Ala-D/L-Glu epimerase [Microvirga mediterraneensis]